MNCWVRPKAMLGSAGVTAIDISVAAVTVSVVVPVTEPRVASIVLVPVARAVARPVVLIDATVVSVEVQVTEPVKFAVEPSV